MATTRRHPADEVPINGSSSRTWEDLISSHLDGIPAESGLTPTRMIPTMMQTSQQGGCEDLDLDLPTTPGSDDDGGRSERSTGKKPFLKKGSRAMRTSPLTPKTTPRTGACVRNQTNHHCTLFVHTCQMDPFDLVVFAPVFKLSLKVIHSVIS